MLSYGVLTAYSKLTREVTGNQISVSFSPWIAIISIILSFLTVLLAASGPARQGKDVTVQSRVDQLCDEYLSKNDFFTSSKTQRAADRDKLTNATMLIVYSLTALFGIVGISSAVAAILNSLYQRKKEFAMLRSVGLDKKGLCHLLYTEGFLLVIKPLLTGISILILVSTILIWLQDITVIEFLKVFPLWGLVVYIILTFAIIRGIYMVASRKIRRDIIVEVLKDETV